MLRNSVDRTNLTPMMQQYMEIKDRYEDSILFFRLGDFYEMFFEDGINAARELEIALTGKSAGLDERIPMCGIPYHSANNYIERLIERGYKVAICEQIEDPSQAKGLVKRDVVSVVTPGTVMNIESLKEKDNNYIASFINLEYSYALAFADLSTGEIGVSLIEQNKIALISELLRLEVREVVVLNNTDKDLIEILKTQFNIAISYYGNTELNDEYKTLLSDLNDVRYLKVITLLINYLHETQKRTLTYLQKVTVIEFNQYLKMDLYTKRNLELSETIRNKARNGSLLWLLDKTQTAMGGRNLKKWLDRPLVDIAAINERYDMIEKLTRDFFSRDDLKNLLKEVYDLERLGSRVAYGNANARDLAQLSKTLNVLPEIGQIIAELDFGYEIENLENLALLLENSIIENPPVSIKEGNLIKGGFNQELDKLKDARKNGKDWIAQLEATEREKTGIKNLKVGFNKVFGYYIEITKSNIGLIDAFPYYERKQTLANCERFITPDLKEKESLILGAEEKIINLEYELFLEIREEVKKYITSLQNNAKVIADIDCLISLSYCSEEYHFIRPHLNTDNVIEIKNGRHPVVEHVLHNGYIANDVYMNEHESVLLITGPNMAGKSTYMRQMAIITVMAQIGSFVPAEYANLPIFDKIFTRIGASDDLISGQSTFMVEMMEANNAIQNATINSLILFDELGRGTATYDGMSLAQAIIEYVHDHIKAKTFFSTHYHELTDLEKTLPNLKNVHVSAVEENGNVVFLHKVKIGAQDKSYGIHVAKLADLPKPLIKRAELILNEYEKAHNNQVTIDKQLSFDFDNTLLENKENEIITSLRDLDPLTMTPLDALNKLYELKQKLKNLDNN